jgi:hypothetical protein
MRIMDVLFGGAVNKKATDIGLLIVRVLGAAWRWRLRTGGAKSRPRPRSSRGWQLSQSSVAGCSSFWG